MKAKEEQDKMYDHICERTIQRLQCVLADESAADSEKEAQLWKTLGTFQGVPFFTAKHLEFTYIIKGNEMFISRKEKSITRATVMIAFHRALALGEAVTGPKKLGTFGASYLYPVFIKLGIIPGRPVRSNCSGADII